MRDYTLDDTKAALSDLRQRVGRYAAATPVDGGTVLTETSAIARSLIDLTHIVDNVALDTDQRLRALERMAGAR